MSLVGQVAVITGGACGIGKAAVEKWVAEGGSAVIADIADEQGRALAARFPGKTTFVHCDTTQLVDLEAAAAAGQRLGPVTCWFNNAGGTAPVDTIADLSDCETAKFARLRKLVDLNLNSYIEGTGVALKTLSKDRPTAIVCTASMAGLLPVGAPPVYSATKTANIQFTRSIGLTLGDKANVRLYALCPTYAATALGPDPEMIRGSLGAVPTADDMADGFMLLVQERPANGSVMRVTVRGGGKKLTYDLMTYGKELGGREAPREGIFVKAKEMLHGELPQSKL
eukprot:TRINITY_DN305_c0_g2_i1.p1 TRINITY_DN305_c0_g2~~TRINITY_DN305_c0_g2_i1.p1  ORF type:complete len:283 (+),score=60.07 TRINITY_DN305_c0_g2_i1:85-933(+)